MTDKKILFDGCSFTANNGFKTENQCKFHWPHLLSQHYQTKFDNNAISGSSNEEIFHRVISATQRNSYNVVFVQWSEVSRQWVYWGNDTLNRFTIINQGLPIGFQKDRPEVKQYAKLHYTYFNNYYVNLKKWLLQVLALGGYLRSISQPYVFIKGFENSISRFTDVEYSNNGFKNISPFLKKLLDFDNEPDNVILERINNIQVLLNKVQQLDWLNFDSKSFVDSKVDLSDDFLHPGPQTNTQLTEQLILYCNQLKLLANE